MPNYEKPTFYVTPPSAWEEASDETLAGWEQDAMRVQEANRAAYEAATKRANEAADILAGLLGEHAKLVKRARGCIERPPQYDFSDFKRRVMEARAKREQADQQVELAAQRDAKVQRAVIFLLGRGLALGDEFALANAVQRADDITWEEAVAARIAAGGWMEFDGQNCDGPCQGWDMTDCRCECGNRRVSWSGEYHDFERPCVAAEAY